MIPTGDRLSLTIEKPAAGGRMIARRDGRVLLVSGAIPGEQVTAVVERVNKGVMYARTVSIEQPSPDRRETAADPLCGGCLYAHVSYPRQLELKAAVIADAFARIGRLQLPSPVRVASSPEEGYRMRARLHVRGPQLGFFREGTHDLCEPRQTGQLLMATCDVLERLGASLHASGLDSVREIELAENIDASDRVVHLESAAALDRSARPDCRRRRSDRNHPQPLPVGGRRSGDSGGGQRARHRCARHRRSRADRTAPSRAGIFSGQSLPAQGPGLARGRAGRARAPAT